MLTYHPKNALLYNPYVIKSHNPPYTANDQCLFVGDVEVAPVSRGVAPKMTQKWKDPMRLMS